MDFFSATSDKIINTIKKELFDVADGAPIVGRDHPVVQEMMALPAPVKNDVTCMHPSPAREATARHARMRARRARRACARGVCGVHARACMRARACACMLSRAGACFSRAALTNSLIIRPRVAQRIVRRLCKLERPLQRDGAFRKRFRNPGTK